MPHLHRQVKVMGSWLPWCGGSRVLNEDASHLSAQRQHHTKHSSLSPSLPLSPGALPPPLLATLQVPVHRLPCFQRGEEAARHRGGDSEVRGEGGRTQGGERGEGGGGHGEVRGGKDTVTLEKGRWGEGERRVCPLETFENHVH